MSQGKFHPSQRCWPFGMPESLAETEYKEPYRRSTKKRIAVDWDGTCAVESWPELGDWLPGAVQALKDLIKAGFEVVIHSCRLAPFDLDELTPRDNADQVALLREKLDSAGLHGVGLWLKPFKPPAVWYIDDKTLGFTSLSDAVDVIYFTSPR